MTAFGDNTHSKGASMKNIFEIPAKSKNFEYLYKEIEKFTLDRGANQLQMLQKINPSFSSLRGVKK